MKEKIQLYINKDYSPKENKFGYIIVSRHENGLEWQLTKVIDTLDEARKELQHCYDLRKGRYDVRIVDLMIM